MSMMSGMLQALIQQAAKRTGSDKEVPELASLSVARILEEAKLAGAALELKQQLDMYDMTQRILRQQEEAAAEAVNKQKNTVAGGGILN